MHVGQREAARGGGPAAVRGLAEAAGERPRRRGRARGRLVVVAVSGAEGGAGDGGQAGPQVQVADATGHRRRAAQRPASGGF